MAIVKPETMTFADKKIRMLIAGFPGIGKTTLALSAPKPLYIDIDLSGERIDRNVFLQAAGYDRVTSYDELRRDIGMGAAPIELQNIKDNLYEVETIVIDTGGKLLTVMGEYGKKVDPKYGQRDGSLSLKGYGWLGKEFQRFLDHIITELDKHIVIVFHAVEEKDGDDTKLRIKAEGSSRNTVWELMDLGGFMEMRGNKRTIGFSNCERYYAKGTRGIEGVMEIPNLKDGVPNDFITRLFAEYNSVSAAETERAAADREQYEAAMALGRELIDSIADADTANAAMVPFSSISHALTSKKELSYLWNAKIKGLGLVFDKTSNTYVPKEGA